MEGERDGRGGRGQKRQLEGEEQKSVLGEEDREESRRRGGSGGCALCFEVPEEASLGQIQAQGLRAEKCQSGISSHLHPSAPLTPGLGMLGGHGQADRRAGVSVASSLSLGGVQL